MCFPRAVYYIFHCILVPRARPFVPLFLSRTPLKCEKMLSGMLKTSKLFPIIKYNFDFLTYFRLLI